MAKNNFEKGDFDIRRARKAKTEGQWQNFDIPQARKSSEHNEFKSILPQTQMEYRIPSKETNSEIIHPINSEEEATNILSFSRSQEHDASPKEVEIVNTDQELARKKEAIESLMEKFVSDEKELDWLRAELESNPPTAEERSTKWLFRKKDEWVGLHGSIESKPEEDNNNSLSKDTDSNGFQIVFNQQDVKEMKEAKVAVPKSRPNNYTLQGEKPMRVAMGPDDRIQATALSGRTRLPQPRINTDTKLDQFQEIQQPIAEAETEGLSRFPEITSDQAKNLIPTPIFTEAIQRRIAGHHEAIAQIRQGREDKDLLPQTLAEIANKQRRIGALETLSASRGKLMTRRDIFELAQTLGISGEQFGQAISQIEIPVTPAKEPPVVEHSKIPTGEEKPEAQREIKKRSSQGNPSDLDAFDLMQEAGSYARSSRPATEQYDSAVRQINKEREELARQVKVKREKTKQSPTTEEVEAQLPKMAERPPVSTPVQVEKPIVSGPEVVTSVENVEPQNRLPESTPFPEPAQIVPSTPIESAPFPEARPITPATSLEIPQPIVETPSPRVEVVPPKVVKPEIPVTPSVMERKIPTERPYYPGAPVLGEVDFINPETGLRVDFSQARSLPELVHMLKQEKYITNELNDRIDSDSLIALIYDRVLNRQNPNRDWTKITLRHRLRETIYRLTADYMKSPEYADFAGLNFQAIESIDQLQKILSEQTMIHDRSGRVMDGGTMIKYIGSDNEYLLPDPILYKLRSLQNRTVPSSSSGKNSLETSKGGGFRASLSGLVSQIKGWFK